VPQISAWIHPRDRRFSQAHAGVQEILFEHLSTLLIAQLWEAQL
jgi:hypothetical protein